MCAACSQGADRATVVDLAAQLTYVFDDHADPVGVALAQVAAGSVVGPCTAKLDRAGGNIIPAFALFAKAVIFQLQHRRECEGIVGAGDIHVFRAEPGIWPEDVLGIMPGHSRYRP